MKRVLVCALLCTIATVAMTDDKKPPAAPAIPPDMMLLPRDLALQPVQLLQAVLALHPNMIDESVLKKLSERFSACMMANNPAGPPPGSESCAEVADFLRGKK